MNGRDGTRGRRASSLGLTVVACAGLCAVALVPAQDRGAVAETSRPALVAPETRRDVGAVTSGATVREEFVVWNRGRGRLVLNRPRCRGCSEGLPATLIVPAGESRTIPVAFQAFGSGPLRRAVSLTTSDPMRPRLTLSVIAHVRDDRSAASEASR